MNLRLYGFTAPFGALAENLVNSYDGTLAEPEHLASPAALTALLKAHGTEAPAAPTARDLLKAKELRAAVRAVFAAESQMSAVKRIAALASGARLEPELAVSGGHPHLGWKVAAELGVVQALRSAVALNLAFLIAKSGFDRLRICGATPCADVFLDTSRPGGQIFCGPRCATRMRVAAHRARRGRHPLAAQSPTM